MGFCALFQSVVHIVVVAIIYVRQCYKFETVWGIYHKLSGCHIQVMWHDELGVLQLCTFHTLAFVNSDAVIIYISYKLSFLFKHAYEECVCTLQCQYYFYEYRIVSI